MPTDKDLVAAKQSFEGEVKYIAHRYKIPIAMVRAVMIEEGKLGKPSRSRGKIYAALRLKGFPIDTKNPPKKKVDYTGGDSTTSNIEGVIKK